MGKTGHLHFAACLPDFDESHDGLIINGFDCWHKEMRNRLLVCLARIYPHLCRLCRSCCKDRSEESKS